MTAPYKRKLIEVALPLEAINVASAREKSIRHGHPSTLHLWWARRPLAACRAVLFASLVDDPSSDPERFPTDKAQEQERQRLFGIIEELVQWENTTNEEVLERARAEIRRSTGGNPPPVLDPFCGGGSIPLEAQRLGLTAYASDLNPVAVLITKALIEIPPKFANQPPVHPGARAGVGATGSWKGAAGLAEDVRRYGAWMRDEAERLIGHLYPRVRLPKEQGGSDATVIAWIWARTVTCPNPACRSQMPLVHSFWLSTKAGRQAWAEPRIDREGKSVGFDVRHAGSGPPDGTVGRSGATCLVCEASVSLEYIRVQGRAHHLDARLMAVVAEGPRGRAYLPGTSEQEAIAKSAIPLWSPEEEIAFNPRDIKAPTYGFSRFGDLFTPRQLVALTAFVDLVPAVRRLVEKDASAVGLDGTGDGLSAGGTGARAYADAVATYLAFAIDKGANYWSSLCAWHAGRDIIMSTFGRQALPMVWDYAEANPFSQSSGNFDLGVSQAAEMLEAVPARGASSVRADDAVNIQANQRAAVSTDPPYYANIVYADLADFFYVWLRRSLGELYPDLFGTVLTPKTAELVATPYRFGGSKTMAEEHFETGLGEAFLRIREIADPSIPVTIYYAFKESESQLDDDTSSADVASTGWETMLEGLVRSGFAIDGTWPMRTELVANLKKRMNTLASSIIVVCRLRPADAGITTRREYLASLKAELPRALRELQQGSIAPVDLAQAAIGPGMAIFSRHVKVLEPNGSRMSVRTALGLINGALDEVLEEQENDFDPDTRWAVKWYEQHGFSEGKAGDAILLATAKGTSLDGLVAAGILKAPGGRVRLKRRDELPTDWDPAADRRVPVWEATQHLIRKLTEDGETGAGELAARLGGMAETAKELAYRLYVLCERQKRAEEALAYNALVVSWPEIIRLASGRPVGPTQTRLGLES